jgi:hypothetical protein
MASSSRGLWGNTYKRKSRGKTEGEKRRKALRAVGASSDAELVRLFTSPGRSVRPTLQVAHGLWTEDRQGQSVTRNGLIEILNALPFGSGDNQRHTNTTLIYKLQVKLQVEVLNSYWGRVCKFNVHWWIVYDRSPTGSLPNISTIFDCTFASRPVTWTVNRDACHRFVVKKHWTTAMSCNGIEPDRAAQVTGPPANQKVEQTKFFKKLGVKTEWKNVGTGLIGDVKAGALYIIGMPANEMTVNVFGSFRMYFKSTGLQ